MLLLLFCFFPDEQPIESTTARTNTTRASLETRSLRTILHSFTCSCGLTDSDTDSSASAHLPQAARPWHIATMLLPVYRAWLTLASPPALRASQSYLLRIITPHRCVSATHRRGEAHRQQGRILEAVSIEVRDASCRESEGVPQNSPESPFDKGGLRGIGIKGVEGEL